MFGSQAMRLLRDKWSGAKELAEELYAMFQDKNPVETSGGLTVGAPAGVAPITIAGSTFGAQPAISFGGGSGDPAIGWNPANNDLTFAGDGFLFSYPDGSGGTATAAIGGDPAAVNNIINIAAEKAGGGGGIPGQVGDGSGDTYQVAIYPNGLDAASQTVTVKQLSIDPAATIPSGTWTMVSKITVGKKATYYMQVPVWGPDPS